MRKYDVYAENCPTRLLLDHIADKWTALVLWKISREPVRFNQLRRDVEGISTKVLSQNGPKPTSMRCWRRRIASTEIAPAPTMRSRPMVPNAGSSSPPG